MNEFIEFESEKIFYQINGSGQPLVFLHGFLEDASIWDHVNNVLVQNYQVLLVDLPGHGKSSGHSKIKTMASTAAIVRAILNHCQMIQPIVFGHSMGGYVALELAKILPINLALVHSNFWADSIEKKNNRNRTIEVVKKNKDFFLKSVIPNLFYNKHNLSFKIEQVIKKARQMDLNAIISSTIAMRDRLDNWKVLEQQNLAIVQGCYDPVVSLSQMEYELNKIETSYHDLRFIKNCGHMGFFEQPEVFLETINAIIYKFSHLKGNI